MWRSLDIQKEQYLMNKMAPHMVLIDKNMISNAAFPKQTMTASKQDGGCE